MVKESESNSVEKGDLGEFPNSNFKDLKSRFGANGNEGGDDA